MRGNVSQGWVRRSGRVAAVIVVGAGLAACGLPQKLSDSTKVDYKSANRKTQGVDLEVPPDLSNPRANERYAIPEAGAADPRTASGYQANQATQASQRPSAAEAQGTRAAGPVLASADGVTVERTGDTRWLVVKESPEKLWPVLKEFWQESGFVIDRDDAAAGIMETDWAENRAKLPQDFIRNTIGKVFNNLYSTGERDKFRTRIERRPDGRTEVYITHRGMVETLVGAMKDQTIWQPRPRDPELEAEFLRRLVVRLSGVDAQQAQAEVARPVADPTAVRPGGDGGVKLVNEGDAAHIDIQEGFDRAWRRVGLALDRGSFTVEDRDRSQGIFYVRYIDPDAEARSSGKPGFFGKLFSSKEKDSAASRQYRIKVLAGDGERSQVSVLGREGQQVSTDADRQTVSRILGLLVDQLRQ